MKHQQIIIYSASNLEKGVIMYNNIDIFHNIRLMFTFKKITALLHYDKRINVQEQ